MLVIRKEQMAVLSDYMRQRFEDRMVRFLIATFPERLSHIPEAKAREAHLQELIGEGIKRAAKHAIELEQDVADYLALMVAVHRYFEDQEEMKWARSILDSQEFSGHSKMKLIVHRLPEQFPRDPRFVRFLEDR